MGFTDDSKLVVADEVSPDMSLKREKAEKNLWNWNLAMAVLHGVQGAAALASSFSGNGGFRIAPMSLSLSCTHSQLPLIHFPLIRYPQPQSSR